MTTQTIEVLQRQLADALNRISQLEQKVETMRQNINDNFDGFATVLHGVTEKVGIRDRYSLKTGIDVAR